MKSLNHWLAIAYNPRMLRHGFWWLLILAALACSRMKGPHTARRHGQTETQGVSSTNAPSVSAAPALGSAPSRPFRREFRLVKELACDHVHVHPLPEKTFLSCGQNLFFIDGAEVHADTSYERGLERERSSLQWQIAGIVGNWPEAVWLGTNPTSDSADYGETFAWKNGRWKRVGKPRVELLTAMLPWTEHHAIAVVEPPYIHGARVVALGNEPFAVPQFTPPAVPHERCVTRIGAEATAVLGTGDVMVAGGQTCDVVVNHGAKDVVYTGVGVERLRAGTTRGEFLQPAGVPKIPLSSAWTVTALAVAGPSEILLAANSVLNQDRTIGYFARWQGSSFVEQPMPFDGIVNLVWLEKPDVLWATDLQNNLWRRHSGQWVRIPWTRPGGDDTEITEGWSRGPNDLWLFTRSRSKKISAVYHVE